MKYLLHVHVKYYCLCSRQSTGNCMFACRFRVPSLTYRCISKSHKTGRHEGLNGVPLKSVISKIMAQNSVISKIRPKKQKSVKSRPRST